MDSDRKRLYLDNAATSFPKPPGVVEAMRDFLERIGVCPGRGAYRETIEAGRMVTDCRNAIRKLFGCGPNDHVIFTLNATDSLNMAIKSIVPRKSHVVTTAMDHNSVLRPLNALQERDSVLWTVVSADPRTTLIEPAAIAEALRPDTSLVVVNHASNVTGAVQPIDDIGEICRSRGIPFLVDAAQSAGHIPLHIADSPIDLLACPGHKGLLGPLGTGVLVIRSGIENQMASVREGGTGSASERAEQPENLPDKFESGSHNAVGIAGLLAGVNWLLERGIDAVRAHEIEMMERFVGKLAGNDAIRLFGTLDFSMRVGVFSIRIEGLDPAELSAILEQHFGIITRSGLHCAPLAHRTIGTDADGGTTRISFGPFTTGQEVNHAAEALIEICTSQTALASTEH